MSDNIDFHKCLITRKNHIYLIMGEPESGKSHLVCNLFKQFAAAKVFKRGIAFTPYDVDEDEDSLSFMPKYACVPYSKEVFINYFNNLLELKKKIEKKKDPMTGEKKKMPKNFIIFEDQQGVIKFNDPDILNLISMFRKPNTSFFFILHQISRDFADYLKMACRYAFIFNYTDKKNIKFLNEAFGAGDFSDGEFMQFVRDNTDFHEKTCLLLVKNHPIYGRLWVKYKAGEKEKFKFQFKLFPMIKKISNDSDKEASDIDQKDRNNE